MKRANRVMKMKLQCGKYLELHRIEVALQTEAVYLVSLTIHLQEEVINARENNHLCKDCRVQWAKVQWEVQWEVQWGVQLPAVSPVQELVNKVVCVVLSIFLTL